jgi:hypothetical protein
MNAPAEFAPTLIAAVARDRSRLWRYLVLVGHRAGDRHPGGVGVVEPPCHVRRPGRRRHPVPGGRALFNTLTFATGGDYADFADGSYLPFVTDTWRSVVTPNQALFIPLLLAFEVVVGVLMLTGGRRTQLALGRGDRLPPRVDVLRLDVLPVLDRDDRRVRVAAARRTQKAAAAAGPPVRAAGHRGADGHDKPQVAV